jgi:hypothetical protein
VTTPTDTMLTSASGSAAGYVSFLHYLVRCINNLLISIIYMLLMLRTHKYIYDVTNLLIIAIFWIKMLLKLRKFLTKWWNTMRVLHAGPASEIRCCFYYGLPVVCHGGNANVSANGESEMVGFPI